MRRLPTNIALESKLSQRVRVIAALRKCRVAQVVEDCLLGKASLDEQELQAKADAGKRKSE